MYIKRDIYEKIDEFFGRDEIIALVGLRQIGKTTLLKKIKSNFRKSEYLTFEDVSLLQLFEKDIESFIKTYVKNYSYLFIDEFQYAKNGGKQLKYIYDTNEDIKIFISGSSSSELAIQSLQYLVGRVIIFDIYPLTFEEFIGFRKSDFRKILDLEQNSHLFTKLEPYFEEYLQFGGYPEIIKEESIHIKKELLKNILNTYILKEIKDILGYRNSFEFENLLKRLALSDGGLLNKSSISNDLGINRNKIDEMINILEKTKIINIVRPFLKTKTKQVVKSPKIYFSDLGFKNILIENFNKLELKYDKGVIYESFILSKLIRNSINPKFWRLENEAEVDFVIEKDSKLIAVEIKSKLNSDRISRSSKKFIDDFSPNKIFIFNENIYSKYKIGKTEVIFTNYLDYALITEFN